MSVLTASYIKFLSETVSENTAASYAGDLMKFLSETGIDTPEDIGKIGTEDIENYISSLKSRGMAYSSISRTIASLRKFFAYCLNEGAVQSDPTRGLEKLPTERKLPNTLTSKQVIKLLEAPDGTVKGKRDRAMLEVMYACGAKVSEMISLKVNDVSIKTEVITLSGGGKRRIVPLGRAAIDALTDYLKNARGELAKEVQSDVLFLNFHGQPLTRQGFWKIIKSRISQAGIKENITAQTLRHCFALHLLENGADARSVSEMLGFSDVSSTKIYKDVMNSKIKKVYRQAHPRA